MLAHFPPIVLIFCLLASNVQSIVVWTHLVLLSGGCSSLPFLCFLCVFEALISLLFLMMKLCFAVTLVFVCFVSNSILFFLFLISTVFACDLASQRLLSIIESALLVLSFFRENTGWTSWSNLFVNFVSTHECISSQVLTLFLVLSHLFSSCWFLDFTRH